MSLWRDCNLRNAIERSWVNGGKVVVETVGQVHVGGNGCLHGDAQPFAWDHHDGRGRPACLPGLGRTRGCAPTECSTMVQNHDDE